MSENEMPDGVKMPLRSFQDIELEVGTWSAKNFGMQETPYLRVYKAGRIKAGQPRGPMDVAGAPKKGDFVVGLDSLAPLLGIMEEIGELAASPKTDDKRDALADIAIYLCDYLFREELGWPKYFNTIDFIPYKPPATGLITYAGQLCRCHLKRHQRIRGMEDYVAFKTAQRKAIVGLVFHLDRVAHSYGWHILELLNFTWATIVSKRDWKKDAEAGGGHAHGNSSGVPNLEIPPFNEEE